MLPSKELSQVIYILVKGTFNAITDKSPNLPVQIVMPYVSVTRLPLISSPMGSGLCDKGMLHTVKDPGRWEVWHLQHLLPELPRMLKSNQQTGEARQKEECYGSGPDVPDTNSIHIPFACWQIHCMAWKCSVAECLGGKRKDLMDGWAHFASDHNYPSE